MNKKLDAFLGLSKVFKTNGFSLYMVGGTSRDFLLGKELVDMDFTTDATPDDMKSFIPDGDYTYQKYGNVKYKYDDVLFEITTLRKEKSYKDFRHPNKISFVKSLKTDHKRRDFTINAIYLDDRFNIYDFEHGKDDLDNKIIKIIGNPSRRIKEDPLRILRAIRFSLEFNFIIDRHLDKAMRKYSSLLIKLNPEKISSEIKKIKGVNHELVETIFNEYGIGSYLKD